MTCNPAADAVIPEGGCAPDKCSGCPSKGKCGTTSEPTEATLAIARRLNNFKRIFLVLSGKGGVGKSTVACQLAYYLADRCNVKVSLMDVDVCGPSVPTMTSTAGEEIHESADGWAPISVSDNLQCISIGFMLRNQDDAVIMRGPKKHGVIQQFLTEVDWDVSPDQENWLIIDTPPGTSDEHLSTINLLTTACKFTDNKPDVQAIIVTTPQEVALADVRKEVNFAKQIGLTIRGVIENMSGFVCPCCNKETQIFLPSTGGAQALCTQYGIELLGRIPLDAQLTQAAEKGIAWSCLDENDSSVGLDMFTQIIAKIMQ
ncbi:Nucleotide-binding protein 1 [Spironucleus salmonicida]|uniref:Nucleotide-binding protein 1 n=1 Tax=Spironucleus salmonicida TaxID=348837 RepID=V6LJV7_9EUKA|nr:Nucleotide-binding protein 1 [Spironucleus salmonicida]|eukprot:EST44817.1 Nucleotide-binding protein 1 [Spironucleus salmonicida]